MNNNIKTGEYYKHFKGKNLVEKNIYEIIATKVTYTGEKMSDVKDLVVYKNIFDNKIFVREEKDLLKELEQDKKVQYNQETRIQKLTSDEVKTIKTEEYISAKQEYLNNK